MEHNKIDKAQGSLISHLTELRKRLLKILGMIFVLFAGAWFFSDLLLDFIQFPISPFLKKTEGTLVFISPLEVFFSPYEDVFLCFRFVVLSLLYLSNMGLYFTWSLSNRKGVFFVILDFGNHFIFFGHSICLLYCYPFIV